MIRRIVTFFQRGIQVLTRYFLVKPSVGRGAGDVSGPGIEIFKSLVAGGALSRDWRKCNFKWSKDQRR